MFIPAYTATSDLGMCQFYHSIVQSIAFWFDQFNGYKKYFINVLFFTLFLARRFKHFPICLFTNNTSFYKLFIYIAHLSIESLNVFLSNLYELLRLQSFVIFTGNFFSSVFCLIILTIFMYMQRFRWRRQWQPTPALLPGKSHGWRSLVGCSPWGL